MNRLAHDFQRTSVSTQASLVSNAKPLCCFDWTCEAVATVSDDGSLDRLRGRVFFPVQWVHNGSHLLLNRVQYFINGVNSYSEQSVNILDLRTHAITTVTDAGAADQDAWYEP